MSFHSVFYDDASTEYFEMYLNAIKTHLDNENKSLGEQGFEPYLDEDTGDVSMQPVAGYELYQLHNLEKLMLRSFCVAVIISVETMLVDLCRAVQHHRKQVFAYSDVSGQRGIGQTKKYLEKVLGIDFPVEKSTQVVLNVALRVRNATIHSDSVLRDVESINTIKSFVKDHPKMLKVKEHQGSAQAWLRVDVTLEYARELISLNRNIYKEVYAQMKALRD